MTVEQLIEKLNTIEDKSIRVLVEGYEGGYNDLVIDNTPAIVDIVLNVNEKWYYGKHERVDGMSEDSIRGYEVVKAIIL